MFFTPFWKEKTSRRIYLDFASTTPLDQRVGNVMRQYENDNFANPWSNHADGRRALESLKRATENIATILSINSKEIVFTSGATEANSLAIRGIIDFYHSLSIRPHIIVSAIEHPSIFGITREQGDWGVDVSLLPVSCEGVVDVASLKKLLRKETVLVSIMLANSEIGTLQPLNDIAREIKKWNTNHQSAVLLHSDASQAYLTTPIDLRHLHVDLLTLDAHKFYGPKGIGILFVREKAQKNISPLFINGYETHYLRPGTPSVGLIAGMSEAMMVIDHEREHTIQHMKELQAYLVERLGEISGATINGSLIERVPSNVSASFEGINHEFLQFQLDEAGISVATRSACLESGGEGSPVLKAISSDDSLAIRFTFGRETTKEELQITFEALKKALEIQRKN